MSRQDANAAFALTSFLYGGNAAYIEDLYARFEGDPNSVDAEWRSFFSSLKDASADVVKSAHGASWKQPRWPRPERGELLSALDGDWLEVEKTVGDKIKAKALTKGVEISSAEVQQATRDSIRALMLIRAYRPRTLPRKSILGLEPPRSDGLDRAYGFAKRISRRFSRSRARVGIRLAARSLPSAAHYCQALGVEFMHIPIPPRKPGSRNASKAGTRKSLSPARASAINKLIEAGFENSPTSNSPAPSASASTAPSDDPALEQIIKRGGALGVRDHDRDASRAPQRAGAGMAKPQRAIFHEFKGGSYTPAEVRRLRRRQYHLGASSDREFDGNRVHLSLTPILRT